MVLIYACIYVFYRTQIRDATWHSKHPAIADRAKKIDLALVRTPSQAVATYESNGGNITSPRPYGTDPLADDLEKKQTRDEAFRQKFTFEDIFDSVVNRNNGESFQAAFLFYADVSYRLSHSD